MDNSIRKPDQGKDDVTGGDRSKTAARFRLANAVVAAVITIAFIGHALLASAFGEGMGASSNDAASLPNHAIASSDPVMTVLWFMFALALTHAALSVATTVFMFTDTVRPPSYRKKRHQVLKWITGVVLISVMAIHVAKPTLDHPLDLLTALTIVAALTWHGWTGLKSLTRDLNLRSGAKKPLRIALCAAAALIAVMLIAG